MIDVKSTSEAENLSALLTFFPLPRSGSRGVDPKENEGGEDQPIFISYIHSPLLPSPEYIWLVSEKIGGVGGCIPSSVDQ